MSAKLGRACSHLFGSKSWIGKSTRNLPKHQEAVVMGLALGLMTSLAFNRLLQSQLFSVSSTDPAMVRPVWAPVRPEL